jgi:hypothetical protein
MDLNNGAEAATSTDVTPLAVRNVRLSSIEKVGHLQFYTWLGSLIRINFNSFGKSSKASVQALNVANHGFAKFSSYKEVGVQLTAVIHSCPFSM